MNGRAELTEEQGFLLLHVWLVAVKELKVWMFPLLENMTANPSSTHRETEEGPQQTFHSFSAATNFLAFLFGLFVDVWARCHHGDNWNTPEPGSSGAPTKPGPAEPSRWCSGLTFIHHGWIQQRGNKSGPGQRHHSPDSAGQTGQHAGYCTGKPKQDGGEPGVGQLLETRVGATVAFNKQVLLYQYREVNEEDKSWRYVDHTVWKTITLNVKTIRERSASCNWTLITCYNSLLTAISACFTPISLWDRQLQQFSFVS